MKEPEEDEEDKEEQKTSVVSTTVTMTEPEAEDKEEEEENTAGKYMLLERLIKFIRSKERPLNAVLSGYFSKLFILLLNRKQKSILPYIFSPESDVIECLLYHLYQKSLSELIVKFLGMQDKDDSFKFGDVNLGKQIRAK